MSSIASRRRIAALAVMAFASVMRATVAVATVALAGSPDAQTAFIRAKRTRREEF